MAMSPRLLRPRASGSTHPDAADWASRVTTNGGSFGSSTLAAVSKFCASVQAAGIRDRFFRLNLFAGTGLSAALVPLFRGASLGGTQYGLTTDTNVNFVAGDYGLATGLTGNGSSKYLQTGIRLDQLPAGIEADGHLSAYVRTVPNSNAMISSYSFHSTISADRQRYEMTPNSSTFGREIGQTGPASPTYPALQVGSRSSASSLLSYHAGVVGSEQTSSITPVATGVPFTVFCRNLVTGTPPGSGTYAPTLYFSGSLGSYSIGRSLTAAQVTSFTNAMNTLQTALSRNV